MSSRPADGPPGRWQFRTPQPPRPVRRLTRAPTFSVVIAAYQAVETIAETVESALGQSLPPHEVIVCDDGPDDALVSELGQFGTRIGLIRQRNAGHAAAKNAAARASSGEFVAILDADDVFLPERLAALSELASARPDLDILSTDEYFDVDGRTVGRFYEHNDFPVDDQRIGILRVCFPGGHPAVRRSRLMEIGGFDEEFRAAADWECWLRMILAGSSAGLVDAPLLRYRLHAGAMTARRAESLADRERVFTKHALDESWSAQERLVLAESRRLAHTRTAYARMSTVVRELPRGARRDLFALARDGDLPTGLRARATVAALLPRLARARGRARDRQGYVGRWTGA
jgi:glycosyltransferase involved in cell wall biosynthesis